MSNVMVVPGMLSAAAADVASIGAALSAANGAAAPTTAGVLAAGADEVSAAIASLFSGYARDYQALSAQMARFHQQFVQALTASVGSYAAAEAANASPLQALEQQVLAAINAPTQTLLVHPLIARPLPAETGPAPFRHIPQAPQRPAPLPGQDSVQICRKLLGMTADETERLINERVMFGPAVTA